jgi:transposase-like protein
MHSRYYSPEFKREAVRRLKESGLTIQEVAKECGVSDTSLKRWRHLVEYNTAGAALPVGAQSAPAANHQRQLIEALRETIKAQAETIRALRQYAGVLETRSGP